METIPCLVNEAFEVTDPEKRRATTHMRIDAALYAKAQKLAALRELNVSEMLEEVLRPWVDREWTKEVRRLKEEEGG